MYRLSLFLALSCQRIAHKCNKSVYGYADACCNNWLHHYVMSLSITINPTCFNRLRTQMSMRLWNPREGCLFGAITSPKDIKHKLTYQGDTLFKFPIKL